MRSYRVLADLSESGTAHVNVEKQSGEVGDTDVKNAPWFQRRVLPIGILARSKLQNSSDPLTTSFVVSIRYSASAEFTRNFQLVSSNTALPQVLA